MGDWYHKNDSGVSGPYSVDELRFLIQRKQLVRTDMLRRGRDGAWLPAGNVRALFPARAAAPSAGRSPRPGTTGSPQPPGGPPAAPPAPAKAEPPLPVQAPPPLSAVPPPFPGESAPPSRRWKRRAAGIGAVLVLLLVLLAIWLWPKPVSQSGAGRGLAAAGNGTGSRPGNAETGNQNQPDSGKTQRPPARRPAPADVPVRRTPPTRHQPSPPGDTSPAPPMNPAPDPGGSAIAGSKFFGLRANGEKFVYVVDCSSSMRGVPFQKACEELLRSIHNLGPKQRFYVIFFASVSYPMFSTSRPAPDLLAASSENVNRVTEWITNFRGTGGTAPEDALLKALDLKPDAVFFLTDGAFAPRVVTTVARRNRKQAAINTVGFVSRAGESLLKQIAKENNGKYVFVP